MHVGTRRELFKLVLLIKNKNYKIRLFWRKKLLILRKLNQGGKLQICDNIRLLFRGQRGDGEHPSGRWGRGGSTGQVPQSDPESGLQPLRPSWTGNPEPSCRGAVTQMVV